MDGETAGRTFYKDIQAFAIKTCIAAVAIVLVANWLIDDVNNAISDDIEQFKIALTDHKIGGAEFWGKVEKNLDDMAASDLPVDKKQKLLRDIRVIISRYRPFFDAVQGDLKEEPATSQH